MPRPARKLHRPECVCAPCGLRRQEEKWDRIFKEKFEDPDYYTRPCLPYFRQSPLHEIAKFGLISHLMDRPDAGRTRGFRDQPLRFGVNDPRRSTEER